MAEEMEERVKLAKPRESATSLLGLAPAGPMELVRLVKKGFPYRTWTHFEKRIGISSRDLASMVGIKERTLRRRKDLGRLEWDESDRLLRTSMVAESVLDLFDGDSDAARGWFCTPAKALAGQRPMDLVNTDPGVRAVERLIGRLERGVFG